GYSTELEVANQGHMYATTRGEWWEWNGSGWAGSSDPTALSPPPSSSPQLSADGSILIAGQRRQPRHCCRDLELWYGDRFLRQQHFVERAVRRCRIFDRVGGRQPGSYVRHHQRRMVGVEWLRIGGLNGSLYRAG